MGSVFDLRGRLRAAPPHLAAGRELGVWSLFAAGLIGLELYGRHADTPLEEIVSVAAFSTLAFQLWRRVRPRVEQSDRLAALRRWIGERRLRFGVDLRAEPALEQRVPRPELLLLVALAGAIGALLLTSERWPTDVLRALRGASGLLASGLLTAVWAALLAGTLSALLLPMLLFESRLREGRARQLRGVRGVREARLLWVGVANALAVLGIGASLPARAAPFFALAGVVSGAWLYLPGRPPLRFAWKRRASLAPAAVSAPLFLFGWRLFHFGVYLALVLVSAGSRVAGVGGGTSVTSVLGLAFAWSLAGASVALAVRETWFGWAARRANPASFGRPLVAVHGAAADQRDRVRATLEAAGFEAGFGALRADAELELAPHAAERGWPRRVTLERLSDPLLHRALARRVELQARRRLRRGLTKLLHIARQRRRERDGGIGHWVAPHLWFVVHMGRDGEDELESIGPPYHELLPRSARKHLLVVLAALDVDLLFIEDGVDAQSLQRVLAMTFEFYDMFGERPLEERHFLGLPGIRVLIEELGLDRPLRTSLYPEPDYEQLARARVLHVFRDRGADPEREPSVPRRGRRPRADVLA